MRSMRRSFCVLSFLLLLRSAVSVAQVDNTPRPARATRVTAILSAMTVEVERLGQELTDKTEMTVQGIRFTTGSLKDRRVVLAHSGIGKVNAAMTATLLVEQFQPTHILFTGIAGGLNPDLRPGDVVIPRVATGVIVTGDAFVASPAKKDALRKEFKADATEMEGAAVAQICWQRRVPCLILRSLSDSAGAKAPEDERLFEKSAAQNAARLVTGIIERLEVQ